MGLSSCQTTNDAPIDRGEELDGTQGKNQSLSRVTRYYGFTHRNGPRSRPSIPFLSFTRQGMRKGENPGRPTPLSSAF